MIKRLVVLLVAASLTSSCGTIFGVDDEMEFADAVQIFNIPYLNPIWEELETCSGIRRDIQEVSFFYVNVASLDDGTTGLHTVGQYYPSTSRIFVTKSERNNPRVFRHEMMHALLRHRHGHPSRYFSDVCGTL